MAKRGHYKFGDRLNTKSKLTFIMETNPLHNKCGNKTRRGIFSCECGNFVEVGISQVCQGRTVSCKCHRTRATKEALLKHGKSHTKSHRTWVNMLARCYKESYECFTNYGGRGIKVCDRWTDENEGYINFLKDMGEPCENQSIERRDVNGDYTPGNCCWANLSNQAFNKRTKVTNTSGKTGVYFCKQTSKWRACITKEGKTFSKRFNTFEDAVEYRKQLEIQKFGYHLKE